MLESAERNYAATALLAERALQQARVGDVGTAVVRHQAAAALLAAQAVAAMLAEQNMDVDPEGGIVPLAFTADPETVTATAAGLDQWRSDRMILSLVADAARGAESVSIAIRPRVGYVRYLSPPSCSRCAILAGRFYRWSSGFQRHPGCDCTHLPTTDPRSEFRQNPQDLVDQGLVTGLSKADQRALGDGADLNQLVNAKNGGIQRVDFGMGRTVNVTTQGVTRRGVAGRRLNGAPRLTPDSIYRVSGGDRATAIRLLKRNGYIQ